MGRVFWYAVKHKWFVLIECCHERMFWRGLLHDADKFRPYMLWAYAQRFNTDMAQGRDSTGYYDPHKDAPPAFEHAFFLHTRRNPHHWQYWVEATADGEVVHPMPSVAVREMICDWRGAARAQGQTPRPADWFEANRSKMRLHPDTVSRVRWYLK